MSHNVRDMAYTGEVPWHQIGNSIPAHEVGDLALWREKAGMNWSALKAPLQFSVPHAEDETIELPRAYPEKFALYRSDTREPLGIVGKDYQTVQPAQVIDFYDDLCSKHGFTMETAGTLKNGKIVWALANAGAQGSIAADDVVKAYLLLSTSYDGTRATTAKFTTVRVVCNNTLTMADNENQSRQVTVSHAQTFDAAKSKQILGVGEHFETWLAGMRNLSQRDVSERETVDFFSQVYLGKSYASITDEDEMKRAERVFGRLSVILAKAPGQQMAFAQGTAWGLLNAVTYDMDHVARERTPGNRLFSAWFGAGENTKLRAQKLAERLLVSA